MDLIGKTLGGCAIEKLVGRGGMGEVYLARQLSLDREVAVKVLALIYTENEEFRERFKREARSVAKVNHPNILQIYEVGEAESVYFMVMEFIRGQSVAERLEQRGFIEWREAAGYVVQAARGLEGAARARIIHRDVKPDNLMITEDGIIKVSDFGLAKEFTSAELTHTDAIMGTPAYMSPEQCDGEALDTRTDIYSLGGTFYRIVTGVLPFNAPTAVAMMYKHKHEAVIPPEEYMPGIPADLSTVILKMMEKRCEDRFQSMAEVADAIEAVLRRHPAEDVELTQKVGAEEPSDFHFGAAGPPRANAQNIAAAARGASEVADLVARGESYMQAGRPVAAFTCWQKALGLDPGNDELRKRVEHAKHESTVACLKIAEDMLEEGDIGRQRRDLQKKIQIDPDDLESMEKLQALDLMESRKRQVVNDIRQRLSTSRYREALEMWDALHPALQDKNLAGTVEHVRTHVLPLQALAEEAEALTRDGRLDEAMQKWDEAAALDPNNDKVILGRQETERLVKRIEGFLREGYDFEVQGKADSAVDCYEAVLRLVPHHDQARKKILRCLEERAAGFEAKGHNDAALSAWEKVLERDPKHVRARERRDHLKGVRDRVRALAEEGSSALRRGRYTTAIRRYTQVLRDDPTQQSARHMLRRAQKDRFYRRRLPVFIVLLIVAGVAAGAPKIYLDMQVDEAQLLYRTGAYQKSIAAWTRARGIPVWGRTVRDEAAFGVRRAELRIDHAALEARYEAAVAAPSNPEALASLTEAIVAYRETLRASVVFSRSTEADLRLQTLLWEADLHYAAADHEAALGLYRRAREVAVAHELALPPPHGDRAAGLTAYFAARGREDAGEPARAAGLYQKAVDLLGGFAPAEERLAALQVRERRTDDSLEQAERLLEDARQETDPERLASMLQEVRTLAAALERDPNRPDALRLRQEAAWRLDAGPDMVLLPLPGGGALAVDRYEYPNRAGEVPKTVSFADALRIAREAGKRLPTPEEWRRIAGGPGKERAYPWGDTFDPARCQASVQVRRNGPAPSGSHLRGATPAGVHDLAGNLAEWVDDGRGPDAAEAIAMGGHFATGSADELTAASVKRYPNPHLTHRTVGFRMVKRYGAGTD